jgi:serine acetyltransferase
VYVIMGEGEHVHVRETVCVGACAQIMGE